MKTVYVAGDVVRDFNLLRLPISPAARSAGLPSALLVPSDGGARYLQEMVAIACKDLNRCRLLAAGQTDEAPALESAELGQAFSIWAPHPRTIGSAERVWRIEQFLGCGPAASPSSYAAPSEDCTLDLLLLDDLNLGFRSRQEEWGALLERCESGSQIVLKTAEPIAEGPLWSELVRSHAGRLTVVMDVGSLRQRHAVISEALSWDRTIEDLGRELAEGASARDLALVRRIVIAFGAAGAGVYGRTDSGLELEHFVYHPDELEGEWESRRPGKTAATGAILAASIARNTLEPATFPVFVAVARALSAMRASHDIGGGAVSGSGGGAEFLSFSVDAANDAVAHTLHPEQSERSPLPEDRFHSAFPHHLLGTAGQAALVKSDLLGDLTGAGFEFVAAKATQVVMEGLSPALDAAPKARFGALVTVDRQEIERLNEVRRLFLAYRANSEDKRPLSLAVFGPPGSGKSFAIKQLCESLVGDRQPALEFNMSQFGERAEVHQALDLVRDASVKGQIPLVFWDEFDASGLRWLQEFLAPMQDAEYRGLGGTLHPLGKAIFVFAGGTCSDFQAFDRSAASGAAGADFRRVKGPDFVSRLRGFVNIKGPNPTGPTGAVVDTAVSDVLHLIRRAVLLRSVLERLAPHLINPVTGAASVGASVVRAFLRVQAFHHGSRSLEAIVSMSALAASPHYGVAQLPSADLLRLHVTPDFTGLVQGGELEFATVELLARATHDSWCAGRRKQGYRWGRVRDDGGKTHPLLVPYAELDEKAREANRVTARVTLAKLHRIGYQLVSAQFLAGREPVTEFSAAERTELARIEHDIWLRDRLLKGFAYSDQTNDGLRLHRDIVPFERLPQEEIDLDAAVMEGIPGVLAEHGYALVSVAEGLAIEKARS